MSSLHRLGASIVRKRKVIAITALIATLLCAVIGMQAMERFSLARFQASGSESVQAAQTLDDTFDAGVPNMTLVISAKDGSVDSTAAREAGQKLAAKLRNEPAVADVRSYWDDQSPVLRSKDGSQALILARIAGNATEARKAIGELSSAYAVETGVIKTQVGGRDEVFRQVGAQARQDFLRAEMFILPAMALLLFIVFRRLSAAFATLGIGIFAVFGTLALLAALLPFVEISTFASNLTLVMGLGLALDYSLLMISRFREQRHSGQNNQNAVAAAVATAGRTIIFSGLTVAISLLALLLFPFPFLQSFAYAGIGVVITSVIGAVIILPAIIALSGDRMVRQQSSGQVAAQASWWHRMALRVMQRPLIYTGLALAIVLLLASPALNLRFGLPDDRILPTSAPSRQAQQEIRDNFTAEEADALQIAVTTGITNKNSQELDKYAQKLSQVPGVAQVDYSRGSFAGGKKIATASSSAARFVHNDKEWLSVVPASDRLEEDAEGLVRDVRAVTSPLNSRVGGMTAEITDFRQALIRRMPIVLGVILLATFILLSLMTQSLVLPLVATLLNLLSLSVMFGAIVWIFQQGHFSGVLDFTATGFIEPTIPLLMVCVAYGLSMDYQLFILSRIKEAYTATGNHREAVVMGLQLTAPIILPAAAILALTFSMYLSSSIVQLKMLAVGMAVAIIIDATLIRLLLLPASMRLAGRASWWLPDWLRQAYVMLRLHD